MAKAKTKTKEPPKEHKPNWKEYIATVEDIEWFLRDHAYLRYNVVTGRTECRIPAHDCFAEYMGDDLPTDEWVTISDRIVNKLWRAMSKEKKVRIDEMWRIIDSDFAPAFNPFIDYLERLPPWDGQDYILGMSVSVSVKGGVEEQALFAKYLKKWLVWMVAGWIDPKVVNHVILVLIGEQGSYKTTWFSYLLPPPLRQSFRIKTNSSRMTKDDLIVLSEYGLVCYEELDTMRPSDMNQLKAAVTMTAVDERRPFARYTEHRPHIASFCGTGNNVQFLNDPTGSRRWLPFAIESIESPSDYPFNYEGIYAQAYALYQQGFRYWFNKAEREQLQRHNRQFETVQSEVELVDLYYRKPRANECRMVVSATEALQAISGNISHVLNKENVGRAFTALGFEYFRSATRRGYIAVRRTGLEMEEYRRQLAEEQTMTDDTMTDVF